MKWNEWSVHLRRADAVEARVQIDLSEKKILFRGQGPKEVHPILSASKQLPVAVKTAIETTRQSSADTARAQADKGMTNSIGMKLVPIAKGKFQMDNRWGSQLCFHAFL